LASGTVLVFGVKAAQIKFRPGQFNFSSVLNGKNFIQLHRIAIESMDKFDF